MPKKISKSSKRFKVINIRGTNGSGKTYLMRLFMKRYGSKPVHGEPEPGRLIGEVIGYECIFEGTRVYIVGRYDIMSGGLDNIKTMNEAEDRVRSFVARNDGHVIFEGLLISGVWERWYNFSKEVGGMIWAFLDTPYEKCIEHIIKRNKGEPTGTEHVLRKYKNIQHVIKHAKKEGEHVEIINHKSMLRKLCQIIRD